MDRRREILIKAIETTIVNADLTAIGIMDFDALSKTASALKAAFTPDFHHTFAVKANGLVGVLAHLREEGMGAEVASPGEMALARAAGFEADDIVYDSPAKTVQEIAHCLKSNVAFNIDNEQEMARVDALIERYPDTRAVIGYRINPQIGEGAIGATSTATATSKFGYALEDAGNRKRLLRHYAARPWLRAAHTHTGSQGCPLPLMAEGAARALAFADEVNALQGRAQITHIDIGGGLPVNFASDAVTPTFEDYAAELRARAPALFSGRYRVQTEFGRAIAAKNGFIVTRIEYAKESGGRRIAITHAGAQLMARTAYAPQAWPLRALIHAPDGAPREADIAQADIAGPCCFAGDLIARDIAAPHFEADDYVVIPDTGAYYFSNHFDYNSLPRIAVYAASGDALTLIRKAGTLEEIVQAMGGQDGF